ncbi:methionyl-tRNA formyltransferase [Stratiformator vulcanicus]|uniref:Methionyl-tRNA formyltransferase n=1 Tax=Stratiformator vulcanicus TaxID=2527980 RepID=A0A517QZ78_9PLAN|nr:methionyl-tRNA formyltransferase [Stratiformator vulcanicus]QDT36941.1 Methionyl-tRNA formyltransferase [Stratiformator vulcanicus]
MRIIFFGSGSFGLPTLHALIRCEHEVVAVVTQPDKTGRGHHRHVNPIKEAANEAGLTLLQPANVNDDDSLNELRELKAELFITASYGQLLKQPFLDLPPRGTINLHASLLPKYRGAAPIHYAIWSGETQTGITIFQVVKKLDAGDMLAKVTTPIGPHETTGDLFDRLADLAAPLTLEVIDGIAQGTLTPEPQNEAEVTFARSLRKEQGQIDWSKSAAEVDCHIRAMQPWPGPFTFLRIDDREPERIVMTAVEPLDFTTHEALPGAMRISDDGELFVACGRETEVRVEKLKPAGKREMTATEFTRGRSLSQATFL